MNPAKSEKLILIRGGGLGDFLLTIPILYEACNRYHEVKLFTRACFHPLLHDLKLKQLVLHDLDEEGKDLCVICKDRDVFTFWNDQEWVDELLEAGAKKVIPLLSRPKSEPHFVEHLYYALDWSFRNEVHNTPWLGDYWSSQSKTLWIHPGSGSSKKNACLSFFENRAFDWLEKDTENRIIFSFGESDHECRENLLCSSIAEQKKVQFLSGLSLSAFKKSLEQEAGRYLGNDSGPSHLAAMLGIPTEVLFISTNPEVWRPLGPRVKLLRVE